MINGYTNPYDIFREKTTLPFFEDIRSNANCRIIPEVRTENGALSVKIVDHFLGTGMISSFFEWTGSYVIKSYYNLCQKYIEEEFEVIRKSDYNVGTKYREKYGSNIW